MEDEGEEGKWKEILGHSQEADKGEKQHYETGSMRFNETVKRIM